MPLIFAVTGTANLAAAVAALEADASELMEMVNRRGTAAAAAAAIRARTVAPATGESTPAVAAAATQPPVS